MENMARAKDKHHGLITTQDAWQTPASSSNRCTRGRKGEDPKAPKGRPVAEHSKQR